MKPADGDWRASITEQVRQRHVRSLCQIYPLDPGIEKEAEICEQRCFNQASSCPDYFEQWAKVILGNQKLAQSRNQQGGFVSPVPSPIPTPSPTPPPELNTFPPKPDVITPECL